MTDRASRRAVGTHYEEEAARYLEQQGYQILERNFFNRFTHTRNPGSQLFQVTHLL